MSSPSLHQGQADSTAEARAKKAESPNPPSSVRISVIVQSRYTFDSQLVTGSQIKETAGVPPGFDLYRRAPGGNEPIADDAQVRLRNGDHFFARPSSSTP